MQVFWRDIMSCWQKKILQKYWEGHMPVAMFYSTVISYYFYFLFPCETYKSLSSSENNHTHEKQQKNKTKQDDGDLQTIS